VKAAIIVNPVSGRNRSLRTMELLLSRRPFPDWAIELFPTTGPGNAGAIARELCLRPPDLLAVCGGDGTLNEVASAVPEPPYPVALLPAGTANVLARELNLPGNLREALAIALERKVRRVDLGKLKSQGSRRFLLMAGIGFDAHVAAATHLHSKRRWGIVAYYFSTARSILTYPFPEFQVAGGGESISVVTCIAANAGKYGGGLVLTPDADMTDGLLDILAIQSGSRLSLLRFLLSARLGTPCSFPFVRRFRAASLAVAGPGGVPVQVDGELSGSIPAEITLTPRSFPLAVRS